MAMICELCGKGKQRGHRVSHSGIRTKRIFKPNLQTLWVKEAFGSAQARGGARLVKKRFCTRCLRKVKTATRAVKIGGRRVSAEQTAQA